MRVTYRYLNGFDGWEERPATISMVALLAALQAGDDTTEATGSSFSISVNTAEAARLLRPDGYTVLDGHWSNGDPYTKVYAGVVDYEIDEDTGIHYPPDDAIAEWSGRPNKTGRLTEIK